MGRVPQKESLIKAVINDSLGSPSINQLIDFPGYNARIKQPEVLRGIDIAELRILAVNEASKEISVALHGYEKLNPQVSTPRAIYISYFTMQKTVSRILRHLFSRH